MLKLTNVLTGSWSILWTSDGLLGYAMVTMDNDTFRERRFFMLGGRMKGLVPKLQRCNWGPDPGVEWSMNGGPHIYLYQFLYLVSVDMGPPIDRSITTPLSTSYLLAALAVPLCRHNCQLALWAKFGDRLRTDCARRMPRTVGRSEGVATTGSNPKLSQGFLAAQMVKLSQ